jgi:hypothetical protein
MIRNAWTGERSQVAGKIGAKLNPHACILFILGKQ